MTKQAYQLIIDKDQNQQYCKYEFLYATDIMSVMIVLNAQIPLLAKI